MIRKSKERKEFGILSQGRRERETDR